MIAWLLSCAFLAGWFVSSRWLYGRWRGELQKLGAEYAYCRKCRNYSYTLAGPTEIAIRAMLAGVIWPLTLIAILVTWKPPPTAAEREASRRKMQARIAELEAELRP